MSDSTLESKEREPSFNNFFGIGIPDDIEPSTAVITMVTPRKTDQVVFIDPDDSDNKDYRKVLANGGSVGAKLVDQKDGDIIAYSVQGTSTNERDGVENITTTSHLFAFSFSDTEGWKRAGGNIAFPVKDR